VTKDKQSTGGLALKCSHSVVSVFFPMRGEKEENTFESESAPSNLLVHWGADESSLHSSPSSFSLSLREKKKM
jgi:hypothetical protein